MHTSIKDNIIPSECGNNATAALSVNHHQAQKHCAARGDALAVDGEHNGIYIGRCGKKYPY